MALHESLSRRVSFNRLLGNNWPRLVWLYRYLYNPTVAKRLYWVGRSREDLRDFPEAARREAGHQLHLVQLGLEPGDYRSMPTSRARRHGDPNSLSDRAPRVLRRQVRRCGLRPTRIREEDPKDREEGHRTRPGTT